MSVGDKVDIKTTNLIPNILAQTKAEKKFAYTAMLFRDGICTEGATSNVFAVKDGILYTHPADNHILKGITRQMIVTRVAPSLGILSSKKNSTAPLLMMRTNYSLPIQLVVSSRLSS